MDGVCSGEGALFEGPDDATPTLALDFDSDTTWLVDFCDFPDGATESLTSEAFVQACVRDNTMERVKRLVFDCIMKSVGIVSETSLILSVERSKSKFITTTVVIAIAWYESDDEFSDSHPSISSTSANDHGFQAKHSLAHVVKMYQ